MGRLERFQRGLLAIGFVIAAILLIRFALDFGQEMNIWLAAPFWLLVVAALSVIGANIFLPEAKAGWPRGRKPRGALLAAVPLGFLASSLGCTGLSLEGCSPFCTFIKTVWIPLIAIACAAFFFAMKKTAFANLNQSAANPSAAWLRAAMLLMLFVPLAPHCVCYNIGNGWWIDRIGASPTCYGWGFAAGLIALSALRSNARIGLSLLICSAIISGATIFFIAHHYFHFPW